MLTSSWLKMSWVTEDIVTIVTPAQTVLSMKAFTSKQSPARKQQNSLHKMKYRSFYSHWPIQTFSWDK